MKSILAKVNEWLCQLLAYKGETPGLGKRICTVMLPFFCTATAVLVFSLARNCFSGPMSNCWDVMRLAISISFGMIVFGLGLILFPLRIFPWFIAGTRDVYVAVDSSGKIQEMAGHGIKCLWLPVRWELRLLGTIKRHTQEIVLRDIVVRGPEGVAVPVEVELKIYWVFNPLNTEESFRYRLLERRDWSVLGESFEGPVRTRLQEELAKRSIDDVIATYFRLIGIITEVIDSTFQSKGVKVLAELTRIVLHIPESIEQAYLLRAQAIAQSHAALQTSVSAIEIAQKYGLPPAEVGMLKMVTDGGLYMMGPQGQPYQIVPNIADSNRASAQGRVIDNDVLPPVRHRRGGPRLPGQP